VEYETRTEMQKRRIHRTRAVCGCAGARLMPSWFSLLVVSVCLLLLVFMPFRNPSPVRADTPVSLALSGWGWCPAYRDVANVTLDLNGTMIPRENATEVADLYLAGTLLFNLDATTDNYAVELRGTKVRSLFFLRQVSGGTDPLIAELEGTWLDENNYVACEGRLAVPAPNHVAKPYAFVLRTTDTTVPTRESGGWAQDWDFIVQKGTLCFDEVADRITQSGSDVKKLLGNVLTQMTVILREIRKQGTPYYP
jgi:hypothetical protein